MAVSWQVESPQRVVLSGELDRATVPGLGAPHKLLKGLSGAVTVDLAPLRRVDSAGVALLLELKEAAGGYSLTLDFAGISAPLAKLLRLYSLEEII